MFLVTKGFLQHSIVLVIVSVVVDIILNSVLFTGLQDPLFSLRYLGMYETRFSSRKWKERISQEIVCSL